MNPLRARDFLIPFHEIAAEHVEPGVREALAEAEASLAALARDDSPPSYANTLGALSDLTERLSRVVTVAQHLTSVMNTPELRAAYNAVLPEFSSFFAKLPLDEGLWRRVKAFAETDEARALTGVKRRHLEKTVKDFVRAGADLPDEAKGRAQAITVELSRLATKFSENVLDSTNAFELVLTDPAEVAGLPETALEGARASAARKGQEGWRFTLQAPSYVPFLKYAERRDLRETMYRAYVNRASDAPFDEGAFDNRPLIEEILRLRHEKAALLGYRNFADYRLELNMVGSGERAYDFVSDLTAKTRPYWRAEIQDILEQAESMGIQDLQPWDLAYVTEGLRRARYSFDEEALRPYFPLDRVMAGMFEICRRLFGVQVRERPLEAVWHPEVAFYDVFGEDGVHLGSFYADWFPREEKRAGAWMNAFITGGPQEDGSFAPHLGLMIGNFTPPSEGKPALLTHDEVQTTFHEFGHLLHHCLSRVEVPDRAGTRVAWDFVELPSQIMENWTWEREALELFARHHETGEPIPDELFAKMQAARSFAAASQGMRQLSFGTVDLKLHRDYLKGRRSDDPAEGGATAYAQEVMSDFALHPDFARNHFIAAFSHIFGGGYAASYYAYKWSEVLDADAFTRFRREGIFNRETGRAFVDTILSRGDAADPAELFRAFMGRDPDPAALLARDFGAVTGMPTGATQGEAADAVVAAEG